MTKPREKLCIVIGDAAFSRLAVLLFERTEHMILSNSNQTDDDIDFIDRILPSIVQNTSKGSLQTTWTETSPKVWDVKVESDNYCVMHPESLSSNFTDYKSEPLLSLSLLPIINSELITNEQVVEFRKDDLAKKKLRRLRSFMHTNYEGKSLSYIEDDLLTRIDDYHLVAKKWGFGMLESTLTIGASDKVLSGMFAGLASAVAGIPFLEAAAIGTTAALGTGFIKFHMGKKKLKIDQLKDPISYIIDINEK